MRGRALHRTRGSAEAPLSFLSACTNHSTAALGSRRHVAPRCAGCVMADCPKSIPSASTCYLGKYMLGHRHILDP